MKQSNHRHTAHGHIKKTSESENRQVKVNTNKNKLKTNKKVKIQQSVKIRTEKVKNTEPGALPCNNCHTFQLLNTNTPNHPRV